jgi:hypothetical protein
MQLVKNSKTENRIEKEKKIEKKEETYLDHSPPKQPNGPTTSPAQNTASGRGKRRSLLLLLPAGRHAAGDSTSPLPIRMASDACELPDHFQDLSLATASRSIKIPAQDEVPDADASRPRSPL